MESYLDHGYRGPGPETPKLRSASSPDIRLPVGGASPSSAIYSFPRDSSQIFFTPPTPSNSALYLDNSRPRALTLPYPTPPESNPVHALAARTTPFYLGGAYQESPTRLTGEGRAAPLWSGSESASASGSGWTRSPSFQDSGTGSGSANGENKIFGIELGLSHLSRSSVDVTTRLGVLTDLVQNLAGRVLALEQSNAGQSNEIAYLRHLLEASFPPDHITSTPPLSQSYAGPYQSPLPPPLFPSTSSAPRPSTPPNKSPHNQDSPSQFGHSQSATTSSDASYASQSSTYESSTFDSPSPGSPKQLRRRSRGSESSTQPRLRGASFSAIAPVVAQAKWMAQQSPNAQGRSPEQVTYRSLLQQDSDIDPEIFISRILAHNDQQCSIYLQQRVKIATTDERRVPIYTAVGSSLRELCLNKFGNFLVSRCIEYGGIDLVFSYLQVLKGSFLELSMDSFGCHVVQKLLDCGDQSTKADVIEEIINHLDTLAHKSSGHVWNKILASPNPPSLYLRLSLTGTNHWAEIAKNESGSLIVQSVLENWAGVGSSVIARELLEHVEEVAVTQWGSFVVLHLIEHCAPTFLHAIISSATTLSLDNFGAKAVEKSIKSEQLPSAFMGPFISSICQAISDRRPPIIDIASHSTGAQLLTLLFTGTLTTAEEKQKLIQTVKKYGVTLKSSKEGAKIWFLCERTRSYNGH